MTKDDDEGRHKIPTWAEPSDDEVYVLKLFITGQTPRSTRAIENLRRICDDNLRGRYQLDVVDIYQDPAAAREAQVVAAPTVVKMLPPPLRRIIGDLSDQEKVLIGLNLRPSKPPSKP